MKFLKELIPYIIIIIVVFLVRQFIITPIQVVGSSMEPNLNNGELMLLNKMSYNIENIKRFDIVVVNLTDKALIKRVIGLPGEKVSYKDGKLYVNGKIIKEKFSTNGDTYDFLVEENGYDIIPKNKYFVVGDNRINSSDSRIIGLIDRKNILGKADFILFPLSKFGSVHSYK